MINPFLHCTSIEKKKHPNKWDLKLQVSLNQLEPGRVFVCPVPQAGKGLLQPALLVGVSSRAGASLPGLGSTSPSGLGMDVPWGRMASPQQGVLSPRVGACP